MRIIVKNKLFEEIKAEVRETIIWIKERYIRLTPKKTEDNKRIYW